MRHHRTPNDHARQLRALLEASGPLVQLDHLDRQEKARQASRSRWCDPARKARRKKRP